MKLQPVALKALRSNVPDGEPARPSKVQGEFPFAPMPLGPSSTTY